MAKRNKYLIFKEGGGRMGNQWLNMAHLLAFTLEYQGKFELVNLKFWYFTKYFSSRFSGRLYTFPQSNSSYFLSFILFLLDFFPRVIFRHGSSWVIWLLFRFDSYFKSSKPIVLPPLSAPFLLDQDLANRLSQNNITLEGWGFRNWNLLEKHANQVRGLLFPNHFQVRKVEREMKPIRDKYEHVVGVFIRQTDYKTWKDGVFYFTLEQYNQWTEVYQKQYLKPGVKVAFVIVTDEPRVVLDLKDKGENYFVYHGHTIYYYLRNIIRLSKCDAILSPPSTFAALAAFIGQKKIIPLYSGNEGLDENENLHNSFFDARNHPVFKVAVN